MLSQKWTCSSGPSKPFWVPWATVSPVPPLQPTSGHLELPQAPGHPGLQGKSKGWQRLAPKGRLTSGCSYEVSAPGSRSCMGRAAAHQDQRQTSTILQSRIENGTARGCEAGECTYTDAYTDTHIYTQAHTSPHTCTCTHVTHVHHTRVHAHTCIPRARMHIHLVTLPSTDIAPSSRSGPSSSPPQTLSLRGLHTVQEGTLCPESPSL